MNAHVTVTPLNVKPVTNPRVAVSFTASVSMPKARLGYLVTDPIKPSLTAIQKAVAAYYNLSVNELLSDRRSRYVARPRQVAMWLCKRLTKRSLPDIGRRFGNRDHTTVLHAIRRIEALRETDHFIRYDCWRLLEKFGGDPA